MIYKNIVKALVVLSVVFARQSYGACSHWSENPNILDRLEVDGLCVVTGHPKDADVLYYSKNPKAKFWISSPCLSEASRSTFHLALILSPADFELSTFTSESLADLRKKFNPDLIQILTDDAWHWCRWLEQSSWFNQ